MTLSIDVDSKQAIGLLEAVATSNEKLISLSETLQSHPAVVRALRGFDCRYYQTGVMVELYVDAELQNGYAMSWWVDLSWTETNWIIESKILINRDQGQEVLKEFPDKSPETLKDLIDQLKETISTLADPSTNIDLVTANGS
jgi:hypothetical protein